MSNQHKKYDQIGARLQAIKKPGIQVDVPGYISNLPFYRIVLGTPSDTRPSLLISSGIHGDEPAGIEAVLRFLEQDLSHLPEQFHLVIFPCLNPTGYIANTRENADGIDLNRDYEDDKTTETKLVKQLLKGHRFAAHFDMHEDYDATGMYFYEGRHDTRWLMPQVAERAEKIGPLNGTDGDEGETDIPISEGVYQVDPEWGQVGFVSYVLHNHADHVIMTETPSTAWPMDQRVAVHRLTLDSILRHYANNQGSP